MDTHVTSKPSGLDSTFEGTMSEGICEQKKVVVIVSASPIETYLKCIQKALFRNWMETFWASTMITKPEVMTSTRTSVV